jgi:hypothetical protein
MEIEDSLSISIKNQPIEIKNIIAHFLKDALISKKYYNLYYECPYDKIIFYDKEQDRYECSKNLSKSICEYMIKNYACFNDIITCKLENICVDNSCLFRAYYYSELKIIDNKKRVVPNSIIYYYNIRRNYRKHYNFIKILYDKVSNKLLK